MVDGADRCIDAAAFVQPLATTLHPDASRVALRPFTPADSLSDPFDPQRPRVKRIVERMLAITDAEVDVQLGRVRDRLRARHDDFERFLMRRYYDLAEPVLGERTIGADRKLLIGACFVEEYAFEAAALFNPSAILHPDQGGLPEGATRILLSVRAVGEGQLSSIVFRTVVHSASGDIAIDAPASRLMSPQIETMPGGAVGDPGVRIHFSTDGDLSRVVLFPVTVHQRAGLEDMRLTRFVDDDGNAVYIGTYTAFSGHAVRQELLRTADFRTFELSALRGAASATKGMALFPRRIDGGYTMLGRQDHENIWLLSSNDLYEWSGGQIIVSPQWPWEFIQLGNCGPPIELEEGWLVITHGVGPVRTYCLGA